MSMDDVIDTFDTKVASIWLVIGIGAAKTVENTVETVIAEHFMDITAGGIDITIVALYFMLATVGTTALIFAKTLSNSNTGQ